MRTAITIVLAAAMGIHCSAPAEEGTATADRDVVAGPSIDNANGEAPRPERIAPEQTTEETDLTPPASRGFVTLPSLVLTSITAADGTTYVAGTYTDSIVINGSTFTSTGKEDVFIARRDTDGTIAWARSVGSLRSDIGPKLFFENGQIKLVGTTRGDVDCGAGPIGMWNSEMFFMCYFDDAGSALGGAAFPTGAK